MRLTENFASPGDYPNLRAALAPELRQLPTEDLEAMFAEAGVEAAEYEEFLGGIGKALKRALPTVAKVAQAALPIVGTMVGGPVGTMVGGLAGQAIGAAAGAATARGRGGAGRAIARAVPQMAATGAQLLRRAAPRAAGGAAGQLLQLLNDPRVLQGLMAGALGPAGARSIPVGGQRVNTAAITNLVGQLANQATLEAYAAEQGVEDFADFAPEDIDSANNVERAGALLELLNETYYEAVESAPMPIGHPIRIARPSASAEDYDHFYESYFDVFESDPEGAATAEWA